MDGTVGGQQLTQLKMDVHTSDSGARSLTVSFLVNVQQTLMEDFEAAAHDAVLGAAHKAGHMPVGPILILTDTWTPPEQVPLEDGKPLVLHRSIQDWELEARGRAGDIVQVTASMELGASLL